MTSRHRGLKWKLLVGHRAPSLQRTSYLCVTLLCCARYLFHRRLVSHAFFAHIRHLGIILTAQAIFVPNIISVAPSIETTWKIFIYQILHISLIFLPVICVPCPRSYLSLCHVNLYILLLLLLDCWDSSQRKNHVLNHSITHPAYLMPPEPKLSFRNNL